MHLNLLGLVLKNLGLSRCTKRREKTEGMNSCVEQAIRNAEGKSIIFNILPREETCFFPGKGLIAIGHTLLEKITYPIKLVTFEDDDFQNFL